MLNKRIYREWDNERKKQPRPLTCVKTRQIIIIYRGNFIVSSVNKGECTFFCFSSQTNLWCEDFSIVRRTLHARFFEGAPSDWKNKKISLNSLSRHNVLSISIEINFWSYLPSVKSNDAFYQYRKKIFYYIFHPFRHIKIASFSLCLLKVKKYFINFMILLIVIVTS